MRKILMLSALAACGDSHHAAPDASPDSPPDSPSSLCQPAPLSTALT
jgi:hypothetical protein